MGFDNDTKLIKAETYGMLVSRFIKNNTPQIALVIPFAIALASGVGNFIIFLTKKGYCYYFNLNYSFTNFDNTLFIYKVIFVSVLSMLYWLYSVFFVRILYKRKNLLKKLVCFFVIPFAINFFYCCLSTKMMPFYDVKYFANVIIACALCIFIHWTYAYFMGRFLSGGLNNDVIEEYKNERLRKKKLEILKKENGKEKNNKGNIKEANDEYSKQNIKDKQIEKIYSALLLMVLILITFGGIFYIGFSLAKMEKQFDVVKIENSEYAVIATDGNQFILELCDISKDKKTLVIDKNTYMKVDCKNLIIHRYNFETVVKK